MSYVQIGNCKLYNDDCLEIMKNIPDESIDVIIADLPYGTTYCTWDSIIPMDELWKAYERIIKPKGAIVLTASQPFTSALIMARPKLFRCEWIWDKVNAANFANANKQPLKVHESVLVFGKSGTNYYPIKIQGKANHSQGKMIKANKSESRLIEKRADDDLSGMKFPKSIQTFAKHSSQVKLHPTQKPVELMEYFIKTYSLESNLILDNCMGSGTTGVACMNTNRKFIGIEKDKKYFDISVKRMYDHQSSQPIIETKDVAEVELFKFD